MTKSPISPISLLDIKQRRQHLLEQCQANSLCIVAAASMVTRSNDTEYAFRQASDFWYLTGFDEPEALLLLSNSPQYAGDVSMIFVQPSDPLAETWHGRRLGVDKAAQTLGVDLAQSVDDIEALLVSIIDGHDYVYFAQGERATVDNVVNHAIEQCRRAPKQSKKAPKAVFDIRPNLHEMRLFKSSNEIDAMQASANIACDAHIRAMKFAHAGCNEFQLEAEIKHEFAMQGARDEAYHSIVGGGDNACILHYTQNNMPISDGDLVLIDAGCELHGYASDITRTFPVNGRFSNAQAELYQLVLDAQIAALEVLKPQATISDAMRASVEVLVQGLLNLGILSGSLTQNIEQETWKTYFMHGLGHWLGLDVHDVGIYKIDGKDRLLQAGMVMTVEPGIYIPQNAEVPSQYKGIGIRIEDDIVITQSSNTILTSKVPKSIAEIEALMR